MIDVTRNMRIGPATRTVSSIHCVRLGSSVFQVTSGSKKGSGQKLLFEVEESLVNVWSRDAVHDIFLKKETQPMVKNKGITHRMGCWKVPFS